MGGIWQQFSVPENVQLSLFSINFLRNINVCTVRFEGWGGSPFFSPEISSLAGKGNQGEVVCLRQQDIGILDCLPVLVPREGFVLIWATAPGAVVRPGRFPFVSLLGEQLFFFALRSTWLWWMLLLWNFSSTLPAVSC